MRPDRRAAVANRPERARRILRGLRALTAVVAFLVLGFVAFLMLAWGPSGRPGGLARVLREPEVFVLLASLPVPLAAFPPLSERLAGRALRWLFLPSTLAALVLCTWLTYDALARGFIDEHVPALVLPTLPCALYVSWCLLLPPRRE